MSDKKQILMLCVFGIGIAAFGFWIGDTFWLPSLGGASLGVAVAMAFD